MASNAAEPTPFGPLLSQHVKTILESGLLLDEDYDVLLNASHFKIYSAKSSTIPFRLIAGALATFGSVFVARKYCRPIMALPPIAATITLLYFERSAAWKRNRRQNVVYQVVNSFVQLRKLNSAIMRYMKTRKEMSKEKEAVFNENIREFAGFFIAQHVACFESCLEQLRFLVSITRDLSDDYEGIKQLDVESVLATETINSENCDLLIAKVQDVYTFLTSKYLNYLGLTFCKNLKSNNKSSEAEVLLDKKLPVIKAYLEQLHFSLQKEFNNLRYCASKKLEIDLINRSCFARQLSGKLRQTLVGAVNNLSLIMEKSRSVLTKAENMESDRDLANFQSALADLRDHALATYESLDILCKIYGIASQADAQNTIDVSPKKDCAQESGNMTAVSYNDSSDAVEENYELYIPDDDDDDGNGEAVERHEADQSAIYLSLMLKELRQSLKQHERFVAARNKRGIKEDEDEDAGKSEEPVAIPKFDLNAFEELPPVAAPRLSKNVAAALPPPPPPPLPDVILHDALEINDDSRRTLFDGIRTLSSQLKVKEDVFGDDCASDSD